jgi:hypothetical protein
MRHEDVGLKLYEERDVIGKPVVFVPTVDATVDQILDQKFALRHLFFLGKESELKVNLQLEICISGSTIILAFLPQLGQVGGLF